MSDIVKIKHLTLEMKNIKNYGIYERENGNCSIFINNKIIPFKKKDREEVNEIIKKISKYFKNREKDIEKI